MDKKNNQKNSSQKNNQKNSNQKNEQKERNNAKNCDRAESDRF